MNAGVIESSSGTELLSVPELPAITAVAAPVGVVAEAVSVMTEVADSPLPSVTDAGTKDAVTPAGALLSDRFTVPAKLSMLVIVTTLALLLVGPTLVPS